MSLFQNKYRIETTRLDCWDYSKYGYYFVTICTKDKRKFFGDVINENVALNKIGNATQEIWQYIPQQFEDVDIDEFVIMPNHIHGIIFIRRDAIREVSNEVHTNDLGDAINNSSTKHTGFSGSKNPMIYDIHLGKIIRWFKGRTSYEIKHRLNIKDFAWQPRYYEHIIRNQKELERICEYIYLNPLQWTIDEENPENSITRIKK